MGLEPANTFLYVVFGEEPDLWATFFYHIRVRGWLFCIEHRQDYVGSLSLQLQ